MSEMPEEVLDQARGTSAGNGLPQPGKSVSFEQPPDGGGPAVAGGGGRVHPEYAKLAEERLKAATARIVSLEAEVQLATKRTADEKSKTVAGEQQIIKLNSRVAQVLPVARPHAGRRAPLLGTRPLSNSMTHAPACRPTSS